MAGIVLYSVWISDTAAGYMKTFINETALYIPKERLTMVSRKKIVISSIIIFTLVISLLSVFVFAAGGLRAECETNTDCDTSIGLKCFQVKGVATGVGVIDTKTCRYSRCRTRAVNTGDNNCECHAAGRDSYYFCQPGEKCDVDVGCIPSNNANLAYCSVMASDESCICKKGNSYEVCAPGVRCDMTGGGCSGATAQQELDGLGSEHIDDELPASGQRQGGALDLSGMECPTVYGGHDTITTQCICKKAAGGSEPCSSGMRCSSFLGCYSVKIDRSEIRSCSYGAPVSQSSGSCLCVLNNGREEICGTDTMCTQAYGCRSIIEGRLGNLDITTLRCNYGAVTADCLCDAAQNSGMCRAGSTCTEVSGCISSMEESENIDDFIPVGPGSLGEQCVPATGCSNGLVCKAPSSKADRVCSRAMCNIDGVADIPCECYGKSSDTAETCLVGQVCMRQVGCQSQATLEEKKRLGNAGMGMECDSTDDCDPGLLCRAPSTRADKVCTKPLCNIGNVIDDHCVCYTKGKQECAPGQVCMEDFGCITEDVAPEDEFRFAMADKYRPCESSSECKDGLVCRRAYGDTQAKCMPKPCTVDGTANSICSCFTGGVMQECKVGQVCQTSRGCQGEATAAEEEIVDDGPDFSKCNAQTCSVIQVKLNGPGYSDVFVRQKAPKPPKKMSANRVSSPVSIEKDTKYSVVIRATKSDVKCLRINGKDHRGRSKKFTIWDDWTVRVRGYSDYVAGKCAGKPIPTAGASVSFTAADGRASGDEQDCDERYQDLLGRYHILNDRVNDHTLPSEEKMNVFKGAQKLLEDIKAVETVCG